VAAFGTLWSQFQELIFQALLYLEGITHDWGMAIIVLTVLIRIALLPLTWKQTKSMIEMQRVQPQIKALQEKYKDDKEKLQEETMKFYQENKVNPFGGCLPLLLQFPVLIALYRVLGNTTAKVNGVKQLQPGLMLKYLLEHHETGTFYHIIPNISLTPQMVWNTHNYLAAIPYLLLVLLFAVSIWLPQALMPGDKQQKMIGGYMAIFMLWFGWISPAGVLLYWDVSSLWGVAQQQITMSITKRELASKTPAEAQPSKKQSAEVAEGVSTKKPANKKSSRGKRS
jgi:YidC/Oxa1 family membrane protein insertase